MVKFPKWVKYPRWVKYRVGKKVPIPTTGIATREGISKYENFYDNHTIPYIPGYINHTYIYLDDFFIHCMKMTFWLISDFLLESWIGLFLGEGERLSMFQCHRLRVRVNKEQKESHQIESLWTPHPIPLFKKIPALSTQFLRYSILITIIPNRGRQPTEGRAGAVISSGGGSLDIFCICNCIFYFFLFLDVCRLPGFLFISTDGDLGKQTTNDDQCHPIQPSRTLALQCQEKHKMTPEELGRPPIN